MAGPRFMQEKIQSIDSSINPRPILLPFGHSRIESTKPPREVACPAHAGGGPPRRGCSRRPATAATTGHHPVAAVRFPSELMGQAHVADPDSLDAGPRCPRRGPEIGRRDALQGCQANPSPAGKLA